MQNGHAFIYMYIKEYTKANYHNMHKFGIFLIYEKRDRKK